MDLLLSRAVDLLPLYGPWVLFALAMLETCFVTGLVVPAGVATTVATVMALDGTLSLGPALAGAAAGAAVGDSLGFWVGRRWGESALGQGRLARKARRGLREVDALFGRHPFYSVTLARMVSFVRTLMPLAAGMSGMAYRRFLPYELAGLVGWGAMYVLVGVLARESWMLATRIVGVGGVVVFIGVSLVAWHGYRSRRRRERSSRSAGTAT